MCGGTAGAGYEPGGVGGLSPRVRGNLMTGRQYEPDDRSIPACAGEPRQRPVHRPASEVYPRVCGGTGEDGVDGAASMGLSPRVRGNRYADTRRPARPGSIPACAGEPTPIRRKSSERGVYPRVCGGTRPPNANGRPVIGLSPRVRGNHVGIRRPRPMLRSIPACAGEPAGAYPHR